MPRGRGGRVALCESSQGSCELREVHAAGLLHPSGAGVCASSWRARLRFNREWCRGALQEADDVVEVGLRFNRDCCRGALQEVDDVVDAGARLRFNRV